MVGARAIALLRNERVDAWKADSAWAVAQTGSLITIVNRRQRKVSVYLFAFSCTTLD